MGRMFTRNSALIAPNHWVTVSFNRGKRVSITHVYDDVWIGSTVVILPDLTIGNGSMTVVRKDVVPVAVFGGVPAVKISTSAKKTE